MGSNDQSLPAHRLTDIALLPDESRTTCGETLYTEFCPEGLQQQQHAEPASTSNAVYMSGYFDDSSALQQAQAWCPGLWAVAYSPVTTPSTELYVLMQETFLIARGLKEAATLEIGSSTALAPISASMSPGTECPCIVCLGLGIGSPDRPTNVDRALFCRIRECSYSHRWPLNSPLDHRWAVEKVSPYSKHHVRRHFARLINANTFNYHSCIGRGEMEHFFCPQANCAFTTKRWSDLEPHTVTKHCTNKRRFPCSMLECKYHGEGKGFIRRDKLQSHFQTVHEGKTRPGKANCVIKPKVTAKTRGPSA